MGQFWLLIYTIICFIIPNSAQLDNTKSFIIRIQNDVKPSVFTDVEQWYRATLGNLNSRKINSEEITDKNPNQDFLHLYKNVFHGFAARLTPQEAKELEQQSGVMAVLPDQIRHLHTTRVVPNASLFGFGKGAAVGVAPKARIAVYKICWGEICQESDILAGLDKAVEDGVHVISISIGGSAIRPFHLDPIAIGAFGAMARGVLVSAAAGNSGPDMMTVVNHAPWITTVGASTIDRRFQADLVLEDGMVITGASVSSGKWKRDPGIIFFPLIHGRNASTGEFRNSKSAFCKADSLDKELVKGKIVVCDRGGIGRVKKGEVVKDAGGVGVIVANVAPHGEGMISDSYTIPGMVITESGRKKLDDYMSSQTNPMAKIVIKGTRNGVKPAPVVASFSSRGPSADSVYVLKPDVIAPGVDILAAWPEDVPPSELPSDTRRSGFNILSGTSMSCPHVSGLAALLKGAHPDWSPAMIRSAMMTTAYTIDSEGKPLRDEESYNESSVWSTGAGHIDPEKAVDPGLVYDITANDYLQFLCAMNYSAQAIGKFSPKPFKCNRKHNKPWNINYPSISIANDSEGSSMREVVITRTVTHVGEGVSTYNALVTSPKGANVTVEPQTMRFAAKGEKQSYKVKIVSDKEVGSWGSMETQSAKLIWTDGKHNVVSPIVVVYQHLL
ncbi:hypothetical protein L1987_09753 [Smallanthus sonchifolius]|uniref:Uncharacterized protein n=1 Tax=Smallanthus sonchifolius TaxID=185202 RepID=A0ACB9JQK6_9ASTR|nr:hypothetical protein L1987_09753 [Smallanthus sonchifolius]